MFEPIVAEDSIVMFSTDTQPENVRLPMLVTDEDMTTVPDRLLQSRKTCAAIVVNDVGKTMDSKAVHPWNA
jgi:hypothetical protein